MQFLVNQANEWAKKYTGIVEIVVAVGVVVLVLRSMKED
jgi:hypothetical protein